MDPQVRGTFAAGLEWVDQRFGQLDTIVDLRRHIDATAESLRADIGFVADGFTRRMDRLETSLRDEISAHMTAWRP